MRNQPSAVALGTWVIAVLCGWAAHAQDYPAGMPAVSAYDAALMGPEFAPPPGQWAYPAGGNYGMAPYPHISPYDHTIDEHYEAGGLWFNHTSNAHRQYLFSLEYIRTRMRRPGTDMVGDPEAFRLTGAFDDDQPTFYRTYGLDVFEEDIPGNGIRGRFAVLNGDDTSLDLAVFWVGETGETFDTFWGEGDPQDVNTIRPRGSIPLDDGLGGVLQQFDTTFRFDYSSQAWGANVNWISTPVYGRKNFGIRTMAGIKFLRIGERFEFFGRDSGLTYTINDDGTTEDHEDIGVPPYSSELETWTSSYLAGPEIGLRYELGGSFLRFWGQTTFAIAANNETLNMSGTQFGDPFTTPFPVPTPADPFPGQFSRQRTHTHVSPIIDSQIYAELDILKHLPFFKRSPLFRDAKFRVGYTHIFVGEVVRPGQVIQWTAPNPTIEYTRSRWTMGAVSFAFDWRF